jgi:hypothetical protein
VLPHVAVVNAVATQAAQCVQCQHVLQTMKHTALPGCMCLMHNQFKGLLHTSQLHTPAQGASTSTTPTTTGCIHNRPISPPCHPPVLLLRGASSGDTKAHPVC